MLSKEKVEPDNTAFFELWAKKVEFVVALWQTVIYATEIRIQIGGIVSELLVLD